MADCDMKWRQQRNERKCLFPSLLIFLSICRLVSFFPSDLNIFSVKIDDLHKTLELFFPSIIILVKLLRVLCVN